MHDDFSKPFIEHLRDLRYVVLKSFLAWILGSLLCYTFAENIFEFLVFPLSQTLSFQTTPHRLIYTNLTEAFLTYFKVSMFGGFCLAFPYITFSVWAFIRPGLLASEKKFIKIFLFLAPFFFIFGMGFAYYFVLPKAFSFFLSFESNLGGVPLQLETKISEYVTLIMRFLIAFGLSFQLPVVLSILNLLHLLKSQTLIQGWRYAIVGIAIVSAIITPPDAFSMLLLAIPLCGLYGITIGLLKFLENKKKSIDKLGHHTLDD